MKIRREVISHLSTVWLVAAVAGGLVFLTGMPWTFILLIIAPVLLALTGFLLWFFRDPERVSPDNDPVIVAPADGMITSITSLTSFQFCGICVRSGLTASAIARMTEFSGKPVVRISIFLSLLDVHVNRSPITGVSEFLGYFPGKHLLTFCKKSSDVNQHNTIWIHNRHSGCLLFQIVGPIARRVVYWPDKNRPVSVMQGERIGMMKFGSRLDIYFPEPDIRLLASPGDKVIAGITTVGVNINHLP